MAEAAGGSSSAFAELVRRHQNGLLNFFRRMGANTDAEDLVQETFLRVFKYRSRYRPTARFSTFLYVLARHAWADRGRRAARTLRLQTGLQAEADVQRDGASPSAASGLDVEEALKRLSPKLRDAVVLNVCQGLRYQEVADVLKIPLGTVKSRINLALRDLRRVMNEDGT
jgi:RNA polymerase sigma-70 factor, ECF subfamily